MYKVLLVDDEKFILEGLSHLIDWSALGLEIAGMVRGGKKALEMLATTHVDILITDISMPGMNGLELIRAARQHHDQLKVIILSGYNEFDYLKEGMSLGIENYLLKPVNVSELKHTLVTLLDKLEASKPDYLYDNDIYIIKNNTLHRWMIRQIAPAEWRERRELLQLAPIRRYRLAVVIRKGDLADQVFAELVNSAGDDHPLAYRDLDEDVVIVFQANEEAALMEYVHRWIEDRTSRVNAEGKEPIRMGVGRVELSEISEVTEVSGGLSYDEAKQALAYFLLYPKKQIISYETLNLSKELIRWEGSIRWEQYTQLLHARNAEGLKAAIQEDFANLREQEGMSPRHLWRVAAEVAFRLKLAAEEVKSTDAALEERFSEYVESLHITSEWAELMEILAEIAQLSIDLLQTTGSSPVIQQVLKLVKETYTENWTLLQLGDRFNIHPVYLGQLFRKETGESFAGYMNRYRIEQAKRMLRETSLKVNEVARQVGYWEAAYFNRQFRKYVGVSPMEYKSLV
ncbi:response regulator transcription factor [Paenibacillus senegalimassiliensis]|uniref:response regulator transcription factor n=1 Tax=Paenibacillus senegalimassiliensis TaxID=1737426 RepID=UPI00073EFDF6|nr:response regulator transcription factor [Paenibacillus senegalimassiliensis]